MSVGLNLAGQGQPHTQTLLANVDRIGQWENFDWVMLLEVKVQHQESLTCYADGDGCKYCSQQRCKVPVTHN